jgi:hypothetical protein
MGEKKDLKINMIVCLRILDLRVIGMESVDFVWFRIWT